MLVKMKVQTNFQGTVLKVGDDFEVKDAVGQRWAKCGIADIIEDKGANGSGENGAAKDPKDMTAKELYKLCIDSGIEVAEKQSKAVYLEALGINVDAE